MHLMKKYINISPQVSDIGHVDEMTVKVNGEC